jgi:uncharacterized protein
MDRQKNAKIRRLWQMLWIEPWLWIFRSIFQPARVRRELADIALQQRMKLMLRLAIPLFLCTYSMTLLIEAIFLALSATLLHWPFLLAMQRDAPLLAFNTAFGVLFGCMLACIVGVSFDIASGLTVAYLGAISFGLLSGLFGSAYFPLLFLRDIIAHNLPINGFIGPLYIGPEIIIWGSLRGAIVGAGVGTALRWRAQDRRDGFVRGMAWGGIAGILPGIFFINIYSIHPLISFGIILVATIAGNVAKILTEIRPWSAWLAGGIAGGSFGLLAGGIWSLNSILQGGGLYLGNVLAGVLVAGLLGSVVGVVLGNTFSRLLLQRQSIFVTTLLLLFFVLSLYSYSSYSSYYSSYSSYYSSYSSYSSYYSSYSYYYSYYSSYFYYSYYIPIAATLTFLLGGLLGIIKPRAIIIAITMTITASLVYNIAVGTPLDWLMGTIVLGAFVAGYLGGRYRLPLYPISSISTLVAWLRCQRKPERVFTYLQQSALHWDERVYLPLPGLKQLLLLGVAHEPELAREEIDFIIHERSQQRAAARAALLEIALRDVEARDTVIDIAQFSQRFSVLFPPEAGLFNDRLVAPFIRLNEGSKEAARFCGPLGWQARQQALKEMISRLKLVHPATAFTDERLNNRLIRVVETWLQVARRELQMLEQTLEREIGNPYNPGGVLELNNSLFKGRTDLARQLGEALGRGRPTFLLYGERRMGKSCTIKHLPALLGARYLTVFFDMQGREISASSAIFLWRIAEEMVKVMRGDGIKVRDLELAALLDAGKQNEAMIYFVFQRWLSIVERTLAREERIVLLAFDEFEKLAEAGRAGSIDLSLVLDWFRTIIQHHPQLALLFSGTHTLSEMGAGWSGYFVNVQTLKVSFLQPEETYQLITQPVPDFPHAEVFGAGVVEEIQNVTNGHPLFVQAVCSALLDWLNEKKLPQAQREHVSIAVERSLKSWHNHLQNVWERTCEEQRRCLTALLTLQEADEETVVQQTGLAPANAHTALEALLDRDLVIGNHAQHYRITPPIFRLWLERNSSSQML